ncbi:hypothetical protein [Sphingomonas faeni]
MGDEKPPLQRQSVRYAHGMVDSDAQLDDAVVVGLRVKIGR